ncbi:MAG: hypothetical protein LBH32_09735 [Dysgonamonadaceae bacterium]|jgi:hypothetical protein|nr:hypothetical protein [Dysgonamonadaceae bacterium]
MKIRSVLLLALAQLLVNATATGQSLPGKCKVSTPEYIAFGRKVQPDRAMSQTWQDWAVDKIKNNDFGQANSLAWKVYSDRDNNKTYIEPNTLSAVHSTLGFMEQLYIAEIKNGFALIYKSLYKDALKIKDAQCFGWISVDNLLLWEECPRSHNGVYRKALIINNMSDPEHIIENPPFYLEPNEESGINNNATTLDIMFVMKTEMVGNTKYYLLSREMMVGNRQQNVYGWMQEEYITEWNHRLSLEPSRGQNAIDYYRSRNICPGVFYEMDDARQLWTNEIMQNPLWEYSDFSRQRMDADKMRFLVFGKGEIAADIYPVAAIVTLKSEISPGIIEKLEDLVAEIKTGQDAQNLDIAIITAKKMPLQKQRLKEILKSRKWNETDVNRYISYLKNGGNAVINGYATVKTDKSEYQLFDYVLLFSQKELEELVQQFSAINSPSVTFDAKAFQDTIVKIGQTIFGQLSEEEIRNMDMDRLLGQIYGIPAPLNLCKIEVNKISGLKEEVLKNYITEFRYKLNRLRKIISDANYDGRFRRNNITYYWIPMEDMPGVYENCNKLK